MIVDKIPRETVHYCERFLELLISIEAQLPTRRFFTACLEDTHVVVRCKLSNLIRREEGGLFKQVNAYNCIDMCNKPCIVQSFLNL